MYNITDLALKGDSITFVIPKDMSYNDQKEIKRILFAEGARYQNLAQDIGNNQAKVGFKFADSFSASQGYRALEDFLS